jgi:hypothetical protein
MPPRSKRTVRSRTDYTVAHAYHLCSGHDYVNEAWGGTPTSTAIARGWADLGHDLLELHIAHHPGTRPWGWWVSVAPERRQRVDGKPHPHDDGSVPVHLRQLWYGLPKSLHTEDHFQAIYETQASYLCRVRLLTPAERRALDVSPAEGISPMDHHPSLDREMLRTWWMAEP